MPILTKIAQNAQNASNQFVSARQCLNAVSIIVIAVLIAHTVDLAFYTFKDSS